MDIFEVVESQRASLVAREYRTVKQIVRAYEIAEKRVEKSIQEIQSKIATIQAAGLTVSPAWIYQEVRLENILREIRLSLDDFSKDALEFTQTARADAYVLGAVHASKLAELTVYGDAAGLNAQAFANGQALLSADSPLRALFDGLGPIATEKARQVFAEGIAEGWNPRKIGRRLKSEIETLTSRRAQLIARTEIIRSYRTANKTVYEANNDVLRGWRWTCAKTPVTCGLCLALDGQIFPVDKVLQSHPSCRCSMVPLPNTDFGGPQPRLGEDYFASLSPAEQDRILGKRKGQMYREGKFKLGDNVVWHDSPDWGRSPRPRRVKDLETLESQNKLPSQSGPINLSGYTPPRAKTIDEILSAPTAAAVQDQTLPPAEFLGLEKLNQIPTNADGLIASSIRYYKDPPDFLPRIAITVNEAFQTLKPQIVVESISDLSSNVEFVDPELIRRLMANIGDVNELPSVVWHNGQLWLTDEASVAQVMAKQLLGQKSVTVQRLESFNIPVKLSRLDQAVEDLKNLNVWVTLPTNIDNTNVNEITETLEYFIDRVRKLGPLNKIESIRLKTVDTVTEYSAELNDLVVDYREIAKLKTSSSTPLSEINNRITWQNKFLNNQPYDVNSGHVQKLTVFDTFDDVLDSFRIVDEAIVKFDFQDYAFDLEKFRISHYDLFSLNGYNDVQSFFQEAGHLYKQGLYREGMAPDKLERVFLTVAQKVYGKQKVLPPYTAAENILWKQIGAQAGSNPGGKYFGRDAVERYVKFYQDPGRAETEHLANLIYREVGIDVPETELITTNVNGVNQTVIASKIVNGKTVRDLGGVQALTDQQVTKIAEGYVADAFLGNWDVAGFDWDNMIVTASGDVFRIDNGGALIYRAQGALKTKAEQVSFQDWYSLGSPSTAGFSPYDGQLLPILKRLGYSDAAAAETDLFIESGEELLAKLEKIAGPVSLPEYDRELNVLAWIYTHAPNAKANVRESISEMIAQRQTLLAERLKILNQNRPSSWAIIRKTLSAPAAPFRLQNDDFKEYTKLVRKYNPKAHRRTGVLYRRNQTTGTPSPENVAAFDYSLSQAKYNVKARTGQITTDVLNLDNAIKANQEGFTEDISLVRWLEGDKTDSKYHRFTDADVGSIISDKAFLSTSANENFTWNRDVKLLITARKGEKRFTTPNAPGISGAYNHETEFIFARDILMVVKKVETQWDQGRQITVLEVEILPENIKVAQSKIKFSFGGIYKWIKRKTNQSRN